MIWRLPLGLSLPCLLRNDRNLKRLETLLIEWEWKPLRNTWPKHKLYLYSFNIL
jgi:hypothetical protein